MPPVRMRGDGRKAKDPKKTLLRLLSYMKGYIPTLVLVVVCIVVGAIAQTTGSKNIGKLVDDYILPMVAAESTDFGPLAKYLISIALIQPYDLRVLSVCSIIYFIYMVICFGVLNISNVINSLFTLIASFVIVIWFIVCGLHAHPEKK